MLNAHHIALLAASGTDQLQLDTIRKALEAEGGVVTIVGDRSGTLLAWDDSGWGSLFKVGRSVQTADAAEFEALCIPGGLIGIDALRANRNAVRFVRGFFEAHKPVAAIGHAPQLFIDAEVLKDRKVTGVTTIHTDLRNAGAILEDAPVVVDDGLVTGRTPDDLQPFINKLIEETWEGRHEGQHA